MRHRIKAGKVGSYTPEKVNVEAELPEEQEMVNDVEELFEEDSSISNDDEALAAMELYDSEETME